MIHTQVRKKIYNTSEGECPGTQQRKMQNVSMVNNRLVFPGLRESRTLSTKTRKFWPIGVSFRHGRHGGIIGDYKNLALNKVRRHLPFNKNGEAQRKMRKYFCQMLVKNPGRYVQLVIKYRSLNFRR